MKTVYLLAAPVAMAAHAFLLLGFNQPGPKRVPPTKDTYTYVTSVMTQKDDEPVVVEKNQTDDRSARKGTTDIGPPVSNEPVNIPISRERITMTVFPPISARTIDSAKIVPGIIGVPEGVEGGKTLDPVKIYSSLDLDRSPKARLQPSPIYPVLAKSGGITGEVVVTFTVDENGRVLSPRVLKSTDRMFDEPTLDAVSKWRFEPGKKDGRPVRFKMAVPVTFKLNE